MQQMVMMKKLILCTLLLILSLRHNTAKRPLMSIILQRCTSHCNPEYCKISMICRPWNRTSKYVSSDIYYHPGVTLSAPVYMEVVTFKKFATVYRPFMIKLRSELCQELSLQIHPFFSLLKKQFMENKSFASNMWDPCPITGHRYIKPRISNPYEYLVDQIPILPAGEWRYDVKISHERNGSEVLVLRWSDYYEIKTLTAEQF